MDFGDLHIVGPSPLNQDRTCVSGQTCRVTDLLGHLGSGDRLHAVDGVRFVQLPCCSGLLPASSQVVLGCSRLAPGLFWAAPG